MKASSTKASRILGGNAVDPICGPWLMKASSTKASRRLGGNTVDPICRPWLTKASLTKASRELGAFIEQGQPGNGHKCCRSNMQALVDEAFIDQGQMDVESRGCIHD